MNQLQTLKDAIVVAQGNLNEAVRALSAFEALPENNVFDDLESALSTIEEKLLDEASLACEGSHNCGADVYTQAFIVDGVTYIGTLKPEYNRHDKTYYYVDGHDFTHAIA